MQWFTVYVVGPPSNQRDNKSPAKFTRIVRVLAVDRRHAAELAAVK